MERFLEWLLSFSGRVAARTADRSGEKVRSRATAHARRTARSVVAQKVDLAKIIYLSPAALFLEADVAIFRKVMKY